MRLPWGAAEPFTGWGCCPSPGEPRCAEHSWAMLALPFQGSQTTRLAREQTPCGPSLSLFAPLPSQPRLAPGNTSRPRLRRSSAGNRHPRQRLFELRPGLSAWLLPIPVCRGVPTRLRLLQLGAYHSHARVLVATARCRPCLFSRKRNRLQPLRPNGEDAIPLLDRPSGLAWPRPRR